MADVAAPPESPSAERPKAEEPEAAAATVATDAVEDAHPDWLTADFLQGVLADNEVEDAHVRVTGFVAESAVGKGDNYASLMLRVLVNVLEAPAADGGEERAGQRSLIVKCLPMNEMMRGWVEKASFFPREQRMYRDTLPRMQRLLDTRLRSRPFARLAPRALCRDTHGVLVFEDLREQGLKMARRQSGLDLPHCMMVMRALGTFHALTVALREEEPSSVLYEEPFYLESGREDFENYLPRCFETLSQQVETWSGYEQYADKLLNFSQGIFDTILKILAETEDKFKVLNHGDCWVNNVLFKYSEDTEEPTDICIVDFQMCRFASMVMDLQYFLFSSPHKDIRTEKMDDMLSTYHSTYVEVLKELGYEERAVTWEELQQEMRRVLPFGVLSACNLLPIVVAKPGEGLQFDDVTEEEVLSGEVDVFAKALAGDNYKLAMRPLLPFFERLGAL